MPEKTKDQVKTESASAAVEAVIAGHTSQLIDAGDSVRFESAGDLLRDGQEHHFTEQVKMAGVEQALTRADFVERRLEILIGLLKDAKGKDDLKSRASDLKNASAEALGENLACFKDKQKPIEIAYRNLDLFYQRAGRQHEKGLVRVFVAHPSDLSDELFESFAKEIQDVDAFNLDLLTSVIVLTDWAGTAQSLADFGVLAKDGRALVLAEFEDLDYDTAVEAFQGRFKDLKGGMDDDDRWKANVALVGNKPVVSEGVYGSAAVILAAEIFSKGKELGEKLVNVELNYTVGSGKQKKGLEYKWQLDNKKQLTPFRESLIAVTKHGAKHKFWGVDTLSKEPLWGNQIQKVWIKNYLDKVLVSFLNLETFDIHDGLKLRALRDALQKFLKDNTGPGKILRYGQVSNVVVKDADKGILDIEFVVKPVTATTQIDLRYVTSNETGQYEVAEA